MVMLFQRFGNHTLKTSSKMQSSEALSASLHAFESDILNYLFQISLHSKPGVDTYSFSWIQKCLRVLPNIDKAFAKFIADIDYPITEWKSFRVEEYMKDNITLLDHLNGISSSISHMGQACMKLLHALSLVEASPIMLKKLEAILPWCSNKKVEDQEEGKVSSGKDLVLHQALLVRKRVKNWICRIIDSSIRGDTAQSCLVMNSECGGLYNSSLGSLQSGVCEEMKRKTVVKEVVEINNGVVRLQAAAAKEGRHGDEPKELRERVEVLGKLLEGVKEDVNKLFAEALVRRNELLDSLEHRKE
ncbi:hypothetical protein IFM89_006914 [Coptis chinensis]|uniref:Uncharacterized protein n=1 Tax=Coptis chinensis TaxID=261450 RepID=A0A835LKM7_9MAGN|nr:hypothetical protein IFM89_006914 [Coptis chinensis]